MKPLFSLAYVTYLYGSFTRRSILCVYPVIQLCGKTPRTPMRSLSQKYELDALIAMDCHGSLSWVTVLVITNYISNVLSSIIYLLYIQGLPSCLNWPCNLAKVMQVSQTTTTTTNQTNKQLIQTNNKPMRKINEKKKMFSTRAGPRSSLLHGTALLPDESSASGWCGFTASETWTVNNCTGPHRVAWMFGAFSNISLLSYVVACRHAFSHRVILLGCSSAASSMHT